MFKTDKEIKLEDHKQSNKIINVFLIPLLLMEPVLLMMVLMMIHKKKKIINLLQVEKPLLAS